MKKEFIMKKLLGITMLAISAFLLASCGSAPSLVQYVSPTYKTTQKSLSVEKLRDNRTNEDHKAALHTVDPISSVLVQRLSESKIFSLVNFTDVSTYSDDYTLAGSVDEYGIDYSMTFMTYFPSLLVGVLGAAAGVATGIPQIALIGVGWGGLDFLLDGFAGKRRYSHDYIASISLELKDKDRTTVWKNTNRYKYNLVFTHNIFLARLSGWSYYIDVDEINNSALAYVTSLAVENSLGSIAEKVGTIRLTKSESEQDEQLVVVPLDKEGNVLLRVERIDNE